MKANNITLNFISGILFAVVALSCHVSFAAQPLTLQQIVEKAVTENPEVQAKYHNFKSAQQEQNAANGGFLPKVDLTSTYRKQEKINDNINNTNIPEFQTALVLKQMLFDGFITSGEVGRLDHTARARYYELQSQMQTIALETVKSYNDILRFRQLVEYAKDNYISHKQFYDRIQERVAAGVGRKVDLEQANGRLALAEANLLTETTNLHDVTARYQRLVGELPPDSLQEVNYFKEGVEDTPEKALDVAYKQNPDILSSIEGIVASEELSRSRKGRYYPRLDLQARKNVYTSTNGENSTQAADVLELTANFNLFNGFSDKAGINQAAEEINRSQDLRDKACVDTRQTTVVAYNDILRLKEQMVYRDQHQLSIEKAREAYRKQFDIGQRTLLDLLDTENEYFQARRTYTNTERDMYNAYARTYAAQGGLLKRLGVTRAELPEMAREAYMDKENVCKAMAPVMTIVDKEALLANAKPLSDTLGSTVKNAESPKPAPEPEKVVLSDKVVPDVQFETNSAKIKSISFPILDNAIKTLNTWGDSPVEVAGHTDKRDTSKADYNLELSDKRANAVREYLIKKGIDPNRLSAKGYGFEQPVEPNDPKEGSKANRRVELIRKPKPTK